MFEVHPVMSQRCPDLNFGIWMHCGYVEQLKHQRRAAAVSTLWRCAIPTEVFLQMDLEHVALSTYRVETS